MTAVISLPPGLANVIEDVIAVDRGAVTILVFFDFVSQEELGSGVAGAPARSPGIHPPPILASRLIGRSLAWLPAVPGHGASLNGGYRSVTRTNA